MPILRLLNECSARRNRSAPRPGGPLRPQPAVTEYDLTFWLYHPNDIPNMSNLTQHLPQHVQCDPYVTGKTLCAHPHNPSGSCMPLRI